MALWIPWLTNSEDGKLSYGYSSFRGRRASMEDFYDVKISKIDGQTVSLFGIFDGLISTNLLFSFLLFNAYISFHVDNLATQVMVVHVLLNI